MKTIQIEIRGISPLLMHRFSEEDRQKIENRSSHGTERPNKEEAAERAAYRLPSGNLGFPADNIKAAIRRAAGFRRIGRRSAVPAFAGGVFVLPEMVDLGTTAYVIDERSVVIRATKGRVMRYRPRIDAWGLQFTIQYDESLIPTEQLVRDVLSDAGTKVGIGDFRPERGGAFGRFTISSWNA
jgi:hypothetical protein